MKKAIYPGDYSFAMPDTQDYQTDNDSDVYSECFNNDIDSGQTNPTSPHVKTIHHKITEIDNSRNSLNELRCTRNELIVDLMQEVLPDWIRKRWISMLLEIDLATSITDERIERLCRESSCAWGNLGRLMPDVSCEYRCMADTELVLLINGFNEFANSWQHHKENVGIH